MSIAVFLKNNLKNIPPSIGKAINNIPYSYRPGIGTIYRTRKEEIGLFESYSINQQQAFIFERMKSLVEYAYNDILFYKEFYDRKSFNPKQLKSFDDLKRIPIIDKTILNEYDLEKRSVDVKDRYIVNTGGSSGTPFSFYIEPSAMGHEWAHMHQIWKELDFKPSDLKIVFGGRSDLKKLVEYDVVRNHFAIDIYADYKIVAKELKKVLKRHTIKYLHGYPTSIYDFAIFCREEDPELQRLLSMNLKGVFFGSEYPHAHYRDVIEEVFGVKTISWYGHTERAVLAYEKHEKFKYEPFQTYGFAEALKVDDENYELIGTSYYNFASPLIRYNTNDIISEVESNNGILRSFKVTKGREGEFIIDKDGKKINLTGLIFGRHHELFNEAKYIQVKQIENGIIEIHYVANLSTDKAASLFDSNNVNMDISFVQRDEPVRTVSGKVGLLIK